MTNETTNRREFLKDSMVVLVSVCALSPFLHSCSEDLPGNISSTTHLIIKKGRLYLDLDLPAYDNLNKVGSGIKLTVFERQKPLIVTRVSATEVAAFSSECTHAGNAVLLPQHGVLTCVSGHGGTFDLRGNVLTPPPKSNLDKFKASLEGSNVVIDLRKKL